MDKYNIMVAGAGQTSRANVEALVEDYVYGHGQDVNFVLIYDKKPSQGQVFASQWAKDKGKEVIIFCQEDSNYEGLPSASVVDSDDPLKTACSKMKANSVAFVLTDDEDESTNTILRAFTEAKIPALDLTEGLMPIKFNPKAVASDAPEMPEAEKLEEPAEEEPEPEPAVEDEDDIYPEELEDFIEASDLMDDVYTGVEALIKVIVRQVVTELMGASETPLKGHKK